MYMVGFQFCEYIISSFLPFLIKQEFIKRENETSMIILIVTWMENTQIN